MTFLTRLTLPESWRSGDRVADGAWAFPIVGAGIGAAAGAVLVVAAAIGLPAPLAATAAVAAAVLATGALHEDGLADTFDGFGGGDRSERLAIMRAGNIGTYGVAALVLTLVARIAALGVLASRDIGAAVAALVVAEAVSRAVMVAVWTFVPPARADGLSVDNGRPAKATAATAGTLAFLVLAIAIAAGPSPVGLALATVFAAISTYILTTVISRAIGGRTGDTLGAQQQLTLTVLLAGFSVP